MLATLLLVTALAAQTSEGKKPAETVEPLKLTGCVSTKPAQGGNYTFTEAEAGTRYRLTGKDIKKYAGKKVEVVEAAPRKFAVQGGLYPSPNVAAQAGALDPVQSGIATQPGSGVSRGTGDEFPEFRAGRIRTVTGACQ